MVFHKSPVVFLSLFISQVKHIYGISGALRLINILNGNFNIKSEHKYAKVVSFYELLCWLRFSGILYQKSLTE